MTQEEKAKAYDEAIKKMKGMKSSWVTLSYKGKTVFQDLEYIFPELRENEDERIRKHLIDCVTLTIPEADAFEEISKEQILAWLEKQGQVKESEISQSIKETSKENGNSLTNKAWSEIQNGIILDGVAYELTANFPDNARFFCNNCELYEKCHELEDETLCEFFGAASYRKVFRKMERKL